MINDFTSPAAVDSVAKANKYNKNKRNRSNNQRQKSAAQNIAGKISSLKDAVCNIFWNGDAAFNHHDIPKSTLKDHAVKFESVANQLDITFGYVTRDQYLISI